MSTEANKAVSRRFLEEAFGKGNLGVIDEIVAPDAVPSGPGALPGAPHGPAGSKMLVSVYRTAFPDIRFTIDEQIAEGDKVLTRWTAHGTNTGELAGMPATGKATVTSGCVIDHIVNGKIVGGWAIFDQFGLMQQLGVIPKAPGAG